MSHHCTRRFILFFFFNDTATTEIYTLSLHDALPISRAVRAELMDADRAGTTDDIGNDGAGTSRHGIAEDDVAVIGDRKSTRLNSSHGYISYAVFCLKKKKKKEAYPMERKKWYCVIKL